ncbi:MAG: hypothetical protein WDZ35_15105 [Crocinitomicaceae bacterium]
MKEFIAILGCCLLGFYAGAQKKDSLIASSALDSVITYGGEGDLMKGNCLFVKFTGDPQLFFNQLANFHAQGEKQIERTDTTLSIYQTTKPYWVYGRYSVFASFTDQKEYQYIEIYFRAYNYPENYYMYGGAASAYQKMINQILQDR